MKAVLVGNDFSIGKKEGPAKNGPGLKARAI
jgi:hypothetical protein